MHVKIAIKVLWIGHNDDIGFILANELRTIILYEKLSATVPLEVSSRIDFAHI